MADAGKDQEPKRRRRPATTPEGRENQLVSLAVDLAEKQLAEGTASAQVISHFLKMGSSREKLEQLRLTHENELLQAKTKHLADQANMEKLMLDAVDAMRSYQGLAPTESKVDYDD